MDVLRQEVTLANGLTMPQLHLGLWQMSHEDVRSSVFKALKLGYRGFDCAQMYMTEHEAGQAILEVLNGPGKHTSSGTIAEARMTRADIFYTTKVMHNSTSTQAVRASITMSREQCGLGYIDLVLLHSPEGDGAARLASWRAIEDSIIAGEVRMGGVSNFEFAELKELLLSDLRILPVVNQIEVNPFKPQTALRRLCGRCSIHVQAYSPLARGSRMEHPKLIHIAQKYRVTPAQVLIRWSLHHGLIPLPKSTRAARMKENAAVNHFNLSMDDISVLDSLEEQ